MRKMDAGNAEGLKRNLRPQGLLALPDEILLQIVHNIYEIPDITAFGEVHLGVCHMSYSRLLTPIPSGMSTTILSHSRSVCLAPDAFTGSAEATAT